VQQVCYEFHLIGGPLDGVYTTEPWNGGLMLGPGFNPQQLQMTESETKEHMKDMGAASVVAQYLYKEYRDSKDNDEIEINGHHYRVVKRTNSTANRNIRCHSWIIIRCEHVLVQ
jgi:hypothetical protein